MDDRSRHLAVAVCIVVPLLFGIYALLLGQDANWDLLNYHWYNAYSYLSGRWDTDILPAHTPTFYNPTLDLPLYVLAQSVPARLVGFALGATQGLNFILLFLIADQLLTIKDTAKRTIAAVVIALVGATGGGNLGMIGTTFYDNVVSLFVLGAFALIVRAIQSDSQNNTSMSWGLYAAAGLLAGAGAGLKLPTAVFALGLGAALMVVGPALLMRVARIFAFGVGALVGLTIFAGHWMWLLWSTYQNPVFPYFNSVFQSPMGALESYRDVRFIPETLTEALFFPIISFLDPLETGEIFFRDGRIAAAFVVLAITGVIWVLRRGKVYAQVNTGVHLPAASYLITAAVISYAVWLSIFAIYRYIVPIEMLAPLVIVAALAVWPISQGAQAKIASGIFLGLVLITAPGDWGRITWGKRFIETKIPEIARPYQSIVLMYGNSPTAWVIPAFPQGPTFLRVQGYGIGPGDGDTGLNLRLRELITNHTGDFYALGNAGDRAMSAPLLAPYGLTLDETQCKIINSNLATSTELCPVSRRKNPS